MKTIDVGLFVSESTVKEAALCTVMGWDCAVAPSVAPL